MATTIEATYKIVTPLFGAGADPGRAELRLPSFKGVSENLTRNGIMRIRSASERPTLVSKPWHGHLLFPGHGRPHEAGRAGSPSCGAAAVLGRGAVGRNPRMWVNRSRGSRTFAREETA